MQVFVNGEPVAAEPRPLADFLEELGYECTKVAVAINETFVPRRSWTERQVADEDRIDVLGVIQGG